MATKTKRSASATPVASDSDRIKLMRELERLLADEAADRAIIKDGYDSIKAANINRDMTVERASKLIDAANFRLRVTEAKLIGVRRMLHNLVGQDGPVGFYDRVNVSRMVVDRALG